MNITNDQTPADFLNSYLHRVYDADPLTKSQRIEVSCAFHAGIETMFKFIDSIPGDESDEVSAERIALFRRQNIDCATDINLSRFGEE